MDQKGVRIVGEGGEGGFREEALRETLNGLLKDLGDFCAISKPDGSRERVI